MTTDGDSLNGAFADMLRQRRLAMGIAQEDLAHEVGVRTSSITNWELKKSHPRVDHFIAWCQALGMKVTVEARQGTRSDSSAA